MKVVCTRSEGYLITANIKSSDMNLTKGKIYDVISESKNYYHIKDDRNEESDFLKTRFILLDLHRENLIEEIIK